MTTLKQLIDQLCPDGVEYVRLDEIGSFMKGRGLSKSVLKENGEKPALHYGQIFTELPIVAKQPLTFVDESDVPKNARTAISGDLIFSLTSVETKNSGMSIAWCGGEIVVGGDAAIYKHSQSGPFLAHVLRTYPLSAARQRGITGGAVKHAQTKTLGQLVVPLPPREVQDKIVEYLDAFAALCENLDTEIGQREQQFAEYREKTFAKALKESTMTTLGRVSTSVVTGATPKAGNSAYYEGGTIPWLRTGEVNFRPIVKTEMMVTEKALEETGVKWVEAPSVVVAISGASAGRSGTIEIPVTTNQHCCNLHIDETVAEYRFVFHWTASQYEVLKSLGRGARGDLNTSIIKGFPLPLPPLEVQQDIADKLDAMQALIGNLRREREQRQQQFDFYREKLLMFAPKETSEA